MKICITSQGNNLDSQVDPRFGRCQYFIIVDPVTMKFEAVENQNIGAMGGAGIQSAQLIASKGTEIVLTGNVGPNAFQTLQAAGVKVVTGVMGAIREVIEKFRKEEIAPVEGPNVPGHFGMGQGMGRGMGIDPQQQPQQISKEQELKALKEQTKLLNQQMGQITKRINEISKKRKNKK
ncbi:hypothetical protein ES705_19978 [subsurface metagenome]